MSGYIAIFYNIDVFCIFPYTPSVCVGIRFFEVGWINRWSWWRDETLIPLLLFHIWTESIIYLPLWKEVLIGVLSCVSVPDPVRLAYCWIQKPRLLWPCSDCFTFFMYHIKESSPLTICSVKPKTRMLKS